VPFTARSMEGTCPPGKTFKVNAVGEITHVFGHRFVLKTGSKSVLAGLTPRGLDVVGLRIGDRVALEGEQKPSEIKVSKLERNGETFAIDHGLHGTREDEADPPPGASPSISTGK
jgi:hypothetical protein